MNAISKSHSIGVGVFLLLIGSISSVQASLVLDTSGDSYTDSIDWSTLGAPYTVVSTPASVTSVNGLSATVNNPEGNVEVRAQGSSWGGNFAPNAPLLWNESNEGATTINFSSPVTGAGAQIMTNQYGSFIATISLYDVEDHLLAQFEEPGNATDTDDNSAIFIGAYDAAGTASISAITFSATLTDSSVNDFAIGNLLIGIPEPASCYAAWPAALVFGLAALTRWMRKTERSHTLV